MGGGGGGQPQTTVNRVDERFNPLIDYVTQGAAKINSSGYTPYSGQRYAGTNATQQQGLNMVTDRAMSGDPTIKQATSTLQDTLKGGNTNPYLDSMVQRAQTGVMGNLAALNARSGSFGNTGVMETGANQMGKIATDMYGAAYNTDRANQMGALQLAPQYGQQAYQDASQLMNAGQFQQNQDQQNKDFGYQQFTEQQNLPYKQMAAYTGVLGSGINNTATTTGGGGGK